MSGVRGADRSASTRLDRAHDRRGRIGVAEMLEHQRPRPDLPDRIGDALAGDVRRRAVHRLEQSTENRARD